MGLGELGFFRHGETEFGQINRSSWLLGYGNSPQTTKKSVAKRLSLRTIAAIPRATRQLIAITECQTWESPG